MLNDKHIDVIARWNGRLVEKLLLLKWIIDRSAAEES